VEVVDSALEPFFSADLESFSGLVVGECAQGCLQGICMADIEINGGKKRGKERKSCMIYKFVRYTVPRR
jgi:hypothetical protein